MKVHFKSDRITFPVSRPGALYLALLLLCLSLGNMLSGQNSPKSKLSYKLIGIHVKGLTTFQEDQIVAASGLKLGDYAGEADFKRAIQKLGDTGLFTNLTYSYEYSSSGCKLEFQTIENDKLVPVVFDNLVWFSDDDLIKQLHARVPLFTGKLPLSGDLGDQVAAAINAILADRKISGQTTYLPASSLNGPIQSYVFKVGLHPVVVRNLEFPGASPDEIADLQAAGKELVGRDYLRSEISPQEKFNLLPVYRSHGYLKAAFGDPQPKIVEDAQQTLVDVSIPVTRGIQYKLSEIVWQGNTVFPADKLRLAVRLEDGEPVNAVQLEDDLGRIHRLYGTKGYILAQLSPTPQMNDAESTVKYQINVNEGDQYRMGDLELEGLTAEITKRMMTQFQMKKGDPYDNTYLARFFKTMYRDVDLRVPYNIVPKESVNDQDKSVSIALHFMPKN